MRKNGKLVAIHGNCQTHAIMYYLRFNETFSRNYYLCKMPQLWNEGHKSRYIELFETEVFSHVDILVTQIVAKDNKFGELVSTENILSKISNDCKVIKICNCFFNGYFPQYVPMEGIKFDEVLSSISKEGLAKFGEKIDYNIAKMVKEGKTFEQIVNHLCDENFYTKKYLYNYIFDGIELSKVKEMNCDVQICDFVEANFAKELLFVTTQHPIEMMFIELCRRILKSLGIEDTEVYHDGSILALGIPNDERITVYPSVFKQLGIQKDYSCILYKLPTGKRVTFKEYMKAYISAVFPNAQRGE